VVTAVLQCSQVVWSILPVPLCTGLEDVSALHGVAALGDGLLTPEIAKLLELICWLLVRNPLEGTGAQHAELLVALASVTWSRSSEFECGTPHSLLHSFCVGWSLRMHSVQDNQVLVFGERKVAVKVLARMLRGLPCTAFLRGRVGALVGRESATRDCEQAPDTSAEFRSGKVREPPSPLTPSIPKQSTLGALLVCQSCHGGHCLH